MVLEQDQNRMLVELEEASHWGRHWCSGNIIHTVMSSRAEMSAERRMNHSMLLFEFLFVSHL